MKEYYEKMTIVTDNKGKPVVKDGKHQIEKNQISVTQFEAFDEEKRKPYKLVREYDFRDWQLGECVAFEYGGDELIEAKDTHGKKYIYTHRIPEDQFNLINKKRKEIYWYQVERLFNIYKANFNKIDSVNKPELRKLEIEATEKKLTKSHLATTYRDIIVYGGRTYSKTTSEGDPLGPAGDRFFIEVEAIHKYLNFLKGNHLGYSVPEYAVAFHLADIVIGKNGMGNNGIDYATKLNKSPNSLYNDYTEVKKDSKLFETHRPKALEIIKNNILK